MAESSGTSENRSQYPYGLGGGHADVFERLPADTRQELLDTDDLLRWPDKEAPHQRANIDYRACVLHYDVDRYLYVCNPRRRILNFYWYT